jgi:hypothetical protein
MHAHILRVAARPLPRPVLRPAKVIVLEVRRRARIEAARRERQSPRPAA